MEFSPIALLLQWLKSKPLLRGMHLLFYHAPSASSPTTSISLPSLCLELLSEVSNNLLQVGFQVFAQRTLLVDLLHQTRLVRLDVVQ